VFAALPALRREFTAYLLAPGDDVWPCPIPAMGVSGTVRSTV
jgi:hypothetical protein